MKSNFIQRVAVTIFMVLFSALIVNSRSVAQTNEKPLIAPAWEGQVSQWNGFDKTDFKFENRDENIIPEEAPFTAEATVWLILFSRMLVRRINPRKTPQPRMAANSEPSMEKPSFKAA